MIPGLSSDAEAAAGFALDGFVLHRWGEPVGVVTPGAVIRKRPDGAQTVVGPRGEAPLDDADAASSVAALVAVGSLLLGEAVEIDRVAAALDRPALSRTVSWLCSTAPDCGAVLAALDRASQASVMLFGCGGIGGLAAMILAGSGIGRLVLVDPDVVEASNLNRQFAYRHSDVGRRKVDVLAEELRLRTPGVVVETAPQRAESAEQAAALVESAQGLSAVLLTADDPIGLAPSVSAACARRGVLYCGAGYVHDLVVVSVGEGPSAPDAVADRLPAAVMPSAPTPNVQAAAAVCDQILRRLMGAVEDRREPTVLRWRSGDGWFGPSGDG